MNKDSAEDIDSSRSRSVDFNLQTKTFDGKPRPDANGFTFYQTASLGIFRDKNEEPMVSSSRMKKKKSSKQSLFGDKEQSFRMKKKTSKEKKVNKMQSNLLVNDNSEIDDSSVQDTAVFQSSRNIQLKAGVSRVEQSEIMSDVPLNKMQVNLNLIEEECESPTTVVQRSARKKPNNGVSLVDMHQQSTSLSINGFQKEKPLFTETQLKF